MKLLLLFSISICILSCEPNPLSIDKTIEINIPKNIIGSNEEQPKNLNIYIKEDGLYINDKIVPIDSIESAIINNLTETKTIDIFADSTYNYSVSITVLDIAKKHELKVSFKTDNK